MDNRTFDLYLEGRKDFELAMKIACNHKAIGYEIKEQTLILYWVKHEKMIPLLYEMEVDEVIGFVWGWLERTSPKEKQPDHDGDNEKGFRVYNEDWGHVDNKWEAFVAITPIWAMYGK